MSLITLTVQTTYVNNGVKQMPKIMRFRSATAISLSKGVS